MRLSFGQVVSVMCVLVLSALVWPTTMQAADEVLEVRDVDRILVEYRRLPVYLSLANIEVPESGAIREQALARISEMISGKGVQVLYDEAYGHDEAGVPRVFLREGRTFVNVILVSEGLARYIPSEGEATTYERLLTGAQDQAREAGLGLWAQDEEVAAADPQQEQAAPTAPRPEPDRSPAASGGKGQYAAELNGTYYYPIGHAALANVRKSRLITYPDEASARRAGKQRAPEVNQASIPQDDGTLDAADRAFAVAEEMYAKAQSLPATPERDRAYTEALQVLTEVVQRYSSLLEQSPDNAELGEKLRRTMQLRYGAMKMRRGPG